MSKELYSKVKLFIQEINGMESWWKFSSQVKDNFYPIEETFNKKLSQINKAEVIDSHEKSTTLSKISAGLIQEFDLELKEFKAQIIKTQALSEKSIEILSKSINNEEDLKNATETIKEMDQTIEGLEKFESLNIHPTIEQFVKEAIKASHLVLKAESDEYNQIIPSLIKVRDSLSNIDLLLNEMKNQSQDQQYNLRFAFSDLNKSLSQLIDDFNPKEDT